MCVCQKCGCDKDGFIEEIKLLQARPPEYGGANGSVRRHRNLRACIESLINRLETILESNPEIALDDDIALARRALDDHWNTVQRLAQNAPGEGRGIPRTLDPIVGSSSGGTE